QRPTPGEQRTAPGDQGTALAREGTGPDDEAIALECKGAPPDDASSCLDEQRAATKTDGAASSSELPPDCHWKEPLRSAAAAEETEIVGRDQEPGLRASISDADTGTKPRSHR